MGSEIIHSMKVYGVFGHKHIEMDIPDLLLEEGSIIEIQKRMYRVLSVISKRGKPQAVNVGLQEKY